MAALPQPGDQLSVFRRLRADRGITRLSSMTASVGALHQEGSLVAMFVFFSSRLGILGSIAVSVVVTLILLVVFRVIR